MANAVFPTHMEADEQAGDDLYRFVRETGYIEFLSCLPPIVFRPDRWRDLVDQLPGSLRDFASFFLLGAPLPLTEESSALADLLAPLETAGLLKRSETDSRLLNTILYQCGGIPMFLQPPSVGTRVYFGEDSFGLFSHISAKPGDRVLDLCSGPGIQGLKAGAMGADVTCVEFNPMAASLCQFNSSLNRLGEFSVRYGNLYDVLDDGSQFDQIWANPPLVPVPRELPYAFVGDGGEDGCDVTRQILSGLRRHLAPRGTATIIGMTLYDGVQPRVFDEFSALIARSDMSGMMSVLSHMPAVPGAHFFDGLVTTIMASSNHEKSTIVTRYEGILENANCDQFCTFSLHVQNKPGKLELFNACSQSPEGFSWFVL